MAAVSSALLAIGFGVSAAGVGIQVKGARDAAKASQRAETVREQAMNLDAQRRKRQVIREMQVARATATANATASGAQESSALSGGIAQATGSAVDQIGGIEQNRQFGAQVFAANRAQSKANSQAAFGSGLTSIGGMLMENRGEISRVGASLFA